MNLGVVIGRMSAGDEVVEDDDDADDETMTSISLPPKPLEEDDLPLFLLWKSGHLPSR